jgi:hypothetical protein
VGEECRECSSPGTAVPINLVRHQLRRPWEQDLEGKEFSFCETPGCRVIYFSVQGDVFGIDAIRRPPAYKTGNGGDLLCFCFDASADAAVQGEALYYIRERVRKQECACNVLNPSGECCLGSIVRWQQEQGGRLSL